MSKDPWTDPDPQPGDFDAVLESIDPTYAEVLEGDPAARLRILISVQGEDIGRLERIAEARGQRLADVVPELLREADRSDA